MAEKREGYSLNTRRKHVLNALKTSCLSWQNYFCLPHKTLCTAVNHRDHSGGVNLSCFRVRLNHRHKLLIHPRAWRDGIQPSDHTVELRVELIVFFLDGAYVTVYVCVRNGELLEHTSHVHTKKTYTVVY